MTRVAIVHDYLTQRGGAERVVLALHEAFPEAPIHTALYEPDATYPEFAGADMRPLLLNRIARLRRSHRHALPVLAPAFTARLVDADVVICSSSGWAHGVRTTGRKLVYCYTPARWLHQSARYIRTASTAERIALRLASPALRQWDRRGAASADGYATTSTAVARRILAAYSIEPTIIPPPVRVDPNGPCEPVDGVTGPFDLCVSRLLGYKNIDVLLQASAGVPGHQLVVVGNGPDEDRLRRLAGSRAVFVPQVSEAELRWLYRSCRFLLSASHEDFGLTPLEAAGFGKPSVVLRYGGFLDTIVENRTGLFFDEPEPSDIQKAIMRADAIEWDGDAIRSHAARYSTDSFFAALEQWTGVPIRSGPERASKVASS